MLEQYQHKNHSLNHHSDPVGQYSWVQYYAMPQSAPPACNMPYPPAPCPTHLHHASPTCTMPHPPAPCPTHQHHAPPTCIMPHTPASCPTHLHHAPPTCIMPACCICCCCSCCCCCMNEAWGWNTANCCWGPCRPETHQGHANMYVNTM